MSTFSDRQVKNSRTNWCYKSFDFVMKLYQSLELQLSTNKWLSRWVYKSKIFLYWDFNILRNKNWTQYIRSLFYYMQTQVHKIRGIDRLVLNKLSCPTQCSTEGVFSIEILLLIRNLSARIALKCRTHLPHNVMPIYNETQMRVSIL